jgi:hypothetical protein
VLARVASFDVLPADIPDDAVDLLRATIRGVPGYVGGFHMVDPQTRKALSVVVFEDMAAAQRAGAALAARPEGERVGIEPDRVEYFDAVPF